MSETALITPDPSPDEREAIERALAALPPPRAGERGPWWREGLREAVEDTPADRD